MWYLYLSDTPFSHLLTACRLTPSSSASASCDIPFSFLSFCSFSLNFISITSVCIVPCSAVFSHQLTFAICQLQVASTIFCGFFPIFPLFLHYIGETSEVKSRSCSSAALPHQTPCILPASQACARCFLSEARYSGIADSCAITDTATIAGMLRS